MGNQLKPGCMGELCKHVICILLHGILVLLCAIDILLHIFDRLLHITIAKMYCMARGGDWGGILSLGVKGYIAIITESLHLSIVNVMEAFLQSDIIIRGYFNVYHNVGLF